MSTIDARRKSKRKPRRLTTPEQRAAAAARKRRHIENVANGIGIFSLAADTVALEVRLRESGVLESHREVDHRTLRAAFQRAIDAWLAGTRSSGPPTNQG